MEEEGEVFCDWTGREAMQVVPSRENKAVLVVVVPPGGLAQHLNLFTDRDDEFHSSVERNLPESLASDFRWRRGRPEPWHSTEWKRDLNLYSHVGIVYWQIDNRID